MYDDRGFQIVNGFDCNVSYDFSWKSYLPMYNNATTKQFSYSSLYIQLVQNVARSCNTSK